MKRRALLAAAAVPIALVAIAWAVAPFAGRSALGRGMRDLRRNEGLDGRFGDLRHAGAGFEITGIAIAATSGEPVLSVRSLRVRPVLAWPPAAIDVDGAHVTQRGLETWARGFAGANESWYRKTSQAIARNYGNLPGGRVRATLDDVFVEREGGSIGTRHGVLTLGLPDPSRLEAVFDGDLTMSGACGNGNAFTAATAIVEVAQDSLAIRLNAELGTFNPICRDCITGHVEAERRVPAPGWAAVVTTAATWSGPATPRCLLGW